MNVQKIGQYTSHLANIELNFQEKSHTVPVRKSANCTASTDFPALFNSIFVKNYFKDQST